LLGKEEMLKKQDNDLNRLVNDVNKIVKEIKSESIRVDNEIAILVTSSRVERKASNGEQGRKKRCIKKCKKCFEPFHRDKNWQFIISSILILAGIFVTIFFSPKN
jgi:hypothetical protein